MASRRSLLTAIVVATLLSGCGSPAPTSTSSPTATGSTSSAPAPATTHTLRLDLEPGTQQRIVMSMDLQLLIEVDRRTVPRTWLPEMAMEIDVVVQEPTDDLFTVGFAYADVGVVDSERVDPAVSQEFGTQLARLVGIRGTSLINDRGEVVDGSFDNLGTVDPSLATVLGQLENQFAQLAVVFPDDPIAVGESWEQQLRYTESGLASDVTYTYTLVSLDRDAYVLDVEYRQDIVPGLLEESESVTIEAQGGRIDGSGTMRGSLRRPFADETDLTGSGSVIITASDGNVTNQLVQRLDMSVTTTS